MAAPLCGKQVVIDGLASRPELNGKVGTAESFNDATGRYNVRVDGSVIALRPSSIQAAAHGSQSWGSGASMPALPRGIEPKHAALALAAGLVLLFGFSLLNAALIAGLCLLAHRAHRSEGGLRGALGQATGRVAYGVQRATGHAVSPTQAGFILVSVVGLIWFYWLGGNEAVLGLRSSPSPPRGRRASESSYSRGHERGYDRYDDGYGSGYGGGGFGGWDMSYMIGVAMLGAFVWQLGGGRDPDGWSAGKLWRRVQNLDFFQLLMLSNLLQQVLGGGRRRGYGGGFGRRSMFY